MSALEPWPARERAAHFLREARTRRDSGRLAERAHVTLQRATVLAAQEAASRLLDSPVSEAVGFAEAYRLLDARTERAIAQRRAQLVGTRS